MKKLFLFLALILSAIWSQAQSISEKEKASLLRMREEEKMARDIYLVLDEKWDSYVFSNISKSEMTHMERVKMLLDKFNLPDPVKKNADRQGVFEDTSLQRIYNELTASGKTSLESAFRAGALVEETDIKDLREALQETEDSTIRATYQYLEQASENHLRAFTRNLRRLGVEYTPVLLSKEEFLKIIGNDQRGRGRGYNRN